MKKKMCVCLGMLILMAANVWSQKPTDIPIKSMDNDSVYKPTSVGFAPIPIVRLNELELTFLFPSLSASQIVIMDEDDHCQVVYSESFSSTSQVIVDLEDEGIGEGRYLLWLFAFGQWWEGEFVVEDENE